MGGHRTRDCARRRYIRGVWPKRSPADAGAGGGFILSTGDPCGRETPEENIFAMVAAVERFGRYAPDGPLPAEAEQLGAIA